MRMSAQAVIALAYQAALAFDLVVRYAEFYPRDFKPANLLMDEHSLVGGANGGGRRRLSARPLLWLSDLGYGICGVHRDASVQCPMCDAADKKKKCTALAGTTGYFAPELLTGVVIGLVAGRE